MTKADFRKLVVDNVTDTKHHFRISKGRIWPKFAKRTQTTAINIDLLKTGENKLNI